MGNCDLLKNDTPSYIKEVETYSIDKTYMARSKNTVKPSQKKTSNKSNDTQTHSTKNESLNFTIADLEAALNKAAKVAAEATIRELLEAQS